MVIAQPSISISISIIISHLYPLSISLSLSVLYYNITHCRRQLILKMNCSEKKGKKKKTYNEKEGEKHFVELNPIENITFVLSQI